MSFKTTTDLSAESIAKLAREHNLHFLEECVNSLRAASAFRVDRTLRNYLCDSVETGGFNVVEPFGGTACRSQYSIVLSEKQTFVHFEDFIVAIGHLAMGYPIAGLVLPKQGLFIKLVDEHWAIRESHLEDFARVAAEHESDAPPEPGLDLLSGDPNFAHHVWNQLPTLGALAARTRVAPGVRVVSTHEPLGPLESIFPELHHLPMVHVPDISLPQINAIKKLRLPVGSTFIPASLVSRLLCFFNSRQRSNEELALEQRVTSHGGPILWMSVRTGSRTATNQTELLSTIASRCLSDHPDLLVILDGHSLAEDFANNITYDRQVQRATVEEGLSAAAEICRAIGPKAKDAVVTAIGLHISMTILLAQKATAYFCHHGTVQHKIGWFSSRPGVVHSNKRNLIPGLGEYIKAQSEVATLPTYIDANWVESPATFENEDATSSALGAEDYLVFNVDGCHHLVEAALFPSARAPVVSAAEPPRAPSTGKSMMNRLAKGLLRPLWAVVRRGR